MKTGLVILFVTLAGCATQQPVYRASPEKSMAISVSMQGANPIYSHSGVVLSRELILSDLTRVMRFDPEATIDICAYRSAPLGAVYDLLQEARRLGFLRINVLFMQGPKTLRILRFDDSGIPVDERFPPGIKPPDQPFLRE